MNATLRNAAEVIIAIFALKAGLVDLVKASLTGSIIGNAAEHGTAVLMAARDKMDLAFSIAVGSSSQIALPVAPALVVYGGPSEPRDRIRSWPTMPGRGLWPGATVLWRSSTLRALGLPPRCQTAGPLRLIRMGRRPYRAAP